VSVRPLYAVSALDALAESLRDRILDGAEEHLQLLGAILAGPRRAALGSMREHLERAADDLASNASRA
jgi:DNA-binding GntR family transcriptional regulator